MLRRPYLPERVPVLATVIGPHVSDVASYSVPWRDLCTPDEPPDGRVMVNDGSPVAISAMYEVSTPGGLDALLTGAAPQTHDPPVPSGFLAHGYVHPDWTGNGLGSRLVDALEDVAWRRGYHHVYVEVTLWADRPAPVSLFERRNYDRVWTVEHGYWGGDHGAALYRKQLAPTGENTGTWGAES